MPVEIFSHARCQLGEGPLWHPDIQTLFWFDITKKTLFSKNGHGGKNWSFDDYVSAAGWVDDRTLLVASQYALLKFDIVTGRSEQICALEADNPATRSNDGRADRWGGFWIGTMGLNAERGAGAIYRYYRGELRKLFGSVTIPNSISFPPTGTHAFFTDTRVGKIMRQRLSPIDGWPVGPPTVFLDMAPLGLNPDGAVWDADGFFWNAQWGAARLARYDASGALDRVIELPANQITCPAFGGSDMTSLYATSAFEGVSDADIASRPDAGKTFVIEQEIHGQKEHRVVI